MRDNGVYIYRKPDWYNGYDSKKGIIWSRKAKFRIAFRIELAMTVVCHLEKLGYKGLEITDYQGNPING